VHGGIKTKDRNETEEYGTNLNNTFYWNNRVSAFSFTHKSVFAFLQYASADVNFHLTR
jgi:hypothetical protein